MSKRFEWASFFPNFGLLTLSFASGAPTVVFALWFYLRGQEPKHSGFLTLLMVFAVCAAWGQWWNDRKKHDQDKTRLIAEYDIKLRAKSRDWSGEWVLLERRFDAYSQNIWATRYMCDGIETWSIEAGPSHPDVRDFQELCNSGVVLLATSPGVPSRFAELSRSKLDDYTVWLKFVYELYPPSAPSIVGMRGTEVTANLTQITGLKKFSAMACQHCAGKALL